MLFFQLEKFNTFRTRDKKERARVDRSSFRPPGLDEFAHDGTGDVEYQAVINRMAPEEVESKFEQMLVSSSL